MKTRLQKIQDLALKIQRQSKKLAKLETLIMPHVVELKDTSYRRSGGYFGTIKADTSGMIIFRSLARTKYLNTYECVPIEQRPMIEQHTATTMVIVNLRKKLSVEQEWINERDQMIKAIHHAKKQVKDGTVNTSYVKHFIVGNRNVYGAHPYYQHEDYNKYRAFPANERGVKLAAMLNNYMERNTANKDAQVR